MRHRWMYVPLVVIAGLPALGAPQAPRPSPPAPASGAPQTTETVGVHDPNFHYAEGRDPFENVTLQVKDKGRPREVRSVADLLVEEVAVMGIFRREGKYFALVRGSGLKRSETITAGQKLYNGEVVEIGPYTDEDTGSSRLCVVFRVRTDDPIRPFIRQVKCTPTP